MKLSHIAKSLKFIRHGSVKQQMNRIQFDNTASRFVIVGILNTFVGTVIMLICYNGFGMSYWWASITNYFLTSILSYFLNKKYTFKYNKDYKKSLLRFALNIIVCYIFAYGVAKPLTLWIFSESGKIIRENIALLTGTVLFIILNYLGQKYYAFNKNK